ncbi:hypothetical protein ACOSP7_031162 [Xanthoceras sorbifolium]
MSSARKLRDFKETNFSLKRENNSLKLSKTRAKMVEQERPTRVEGLSLHITELKANIEQLQRDPKVEVDSLEIIAGDMVAKTKAELIVEYKEGKVNRWRLDKEIVAWEELKALIAAEEGEVEPTVGDGAMVLLTADEEQVD